jgi:hypothetical protein
MPYRKSENNYKIINSITTASTTSLCIYQSEKNEIDTIKALKHQFVGFPITNE